MTTSLVWLRDDLRVADNPALTAALASADTVAILYVLDNESPEVRPLGSASRWWLHHSLRKLSRTIADLGGHLILRRGPARDVVPAVVAEVGATSVHWSRRFGAARAIDADLKAVLPDAHSHNGTLLHEPWSLQTGGGTPFKVFTPFWKAYRAGEPPRHPFPAPTSIPGVPAPSDSLESWDLLPTIPWDQEFPTVWSPGEQGAQDRLRRFIDTGLALYHRRDEPGIESTSGLSPHLRFGEISPYQVWHAVESATTSATHANATRFLSEIGWREFSYHQLFHNTDMHVRNLRPEFDGFPWTEPSDALLGAWKKGTTGISLVDAGMRELWATGWMHNRVRMIVASFLTKHLLIDWRWGERYFAQKLLDFELASNVGGWQWAAGSGCDAAPYFRIFNPYNQTEKFDKAERYIQRWVPEYKSSSYPQPVVEHAFARDRCLKTYKAALQ